MAKEILLIEIKENGARVVKRSIDDIGKSADKTEDAVAQLNTVLGGLVSVGVLKNTIMLADTYANLLNRIRVVTESNWELKAAMDGIAKISHETRTSLEANVDMYARVALNTKNMGFEYKDVLRFAKQLNHAIILSGVTAREAQWGMVQFSQALAAGALRGDELRSVMEQLPVVTKVLTKHLGIGRGELRKMAFEGRVTTRVIIDAFNEAEKELAEGFIKRIPTIDQGLTDLRSSFIRFIGEQDQAWQGTTKLAQALLWASENMETLGRLAQVAATILGGVFLANMGKLLVKWQILSLGVLRTHAALILFLTAATALVVFADKIKIASGEAATLADVVRGMAPEFAAAGEAAKDLWNSLAESSGLDKLKVKADITLEGILITLGRLGDSFAGVMQGIVSVVKNALTNISETIKLLLRSIGAFISSIGEKISKSMSNMGNAIESTAKAAKHALKGDFGTARQYTKLAAAFAQAGSDNTVMDIYKKKAVEIEQLFEGTGKSSAEAFMEGFTGAGTHSEDMMKRAIGRGRDIAAARTSGGVTPGVDEGALTPQQAELLKQVTGNVEKLMAKMVDLKVLFDSGRISVEEYDRALLKLRITSLETQTDVASGFKRGLMKVGEEISNFAETAESTITNAFSAMEDALVSFVTTGKVDFKGLVDSILGDLTRLLARQMIMGAISSLIPGGSVVGALAGSAASSATPGRANGGPVSAGGAYTVGERGPERFYPNQSGQIVSNEKMRAEASAPAAQAPPPITVLNVWSTDDLKDFMNGTEGSRIIINKSPGRQSERQ